MTEERFYCPLLKKEIANSLCINITHAAEGVISQAIVTAVSDWEKAKLVCADCGNAYWNKNNMEVPEFVKETMAKYDKNPD